MRFVRCVLAMGLFAFAVQAKADWATTDINNILGWVKEVWTIVTTDVKNMAAEFVQQLQLLQQEGATVDEHVQDTLALIQHRRGPFLDFLYGNPQVTNTRCDQNTPCENFRLDLENFVQDIAALKSTLPQIEAHGLGDGTILVDVIGHAPPAALFGLYQILNNVPNWQE